MCFEFDLSFVPVPVRKMIPCPQFFRIVVLRVVGRSKIREDIAVVLRVVVALLASSHVVVAASMSIIVLLNSNSHN